MWTFERWVDWSAGVVSALLRQYPAEEHALEHVFPPFISTYSYAYIKEYRRLLDV